MSKNNNLDIKKLLKQQILCLHQAIKDKLPLSITVSILFNILVLKLNFENESILKMNFIFNLQIIPKNKVQNKIKYIQ
jgi:hypothetical protein